MKYIHRRFSCAEICILCNGVDTFPCHRFSNVIRTADFQEVMGHVMSLHSSRKSLEGPNFSMWSRNEIEADHASAISTIAKLVEENTRLVGKVRKYEHVLTFNERLMGSADQPRV